MNYRTIDMAEAEARFAVSKHLYGARDGMKMLLVDGDTEVDSLNLDERVEGAYGYIVDGDLTVRGKLKSSDDHVMALLVTGDLNAGIVYASGADTAVLGDVRATLAVIGVYNHGYLHVSGSIEAPYLINANHDLTWQGTLEATALDLYHGDFEAPYTYGCSDLDEDLMDWDVEEVDFAGLMQRLEDGEPILAEE